MDSTENERESLLTAAEVPARLRCSRALVYQLCERGRLSHMRLGVGRGTIRISLRDFNLFLEASHIDVQTPEPPITSCS